MLRICFPLWIALALAGTSRAETREGVSRPNVLLLFADDQQADSIAALGHPTILTPNLDRLARRGLAFDRACMQGGLQGATCVPSRAMLLTGQPLFLADERLLRDPTWPRAFADAGYTTFFTGKWHNGPASISRSFQEARSVFAGGMTDPMQAKLSDLADGKLTRPQPSPDHACQAFADAAIEFLGRKHPNPFFLYVAFDAPHDPHIVPEEFPVHYDPAKVPLPANFLPQHPFDNGEMTIRDEKLLPWPRTERDIRQMIAEYHRYISYLDAQIGRVLDALDASGHARDTLVVFTSDSGVARGSHGLIGKQNLYEPSIRVPLILAGPQIPKAQHTQALCYLFDLLPTLGALCDVPPPPTSQGRSFADVIADPNRPGRSELIFAYRDVQRGLRDDRWKLIRYPKIHKTQLFDLEHDPHELTNLAESPAQAARVADMTTRLQHEMTRLGDLAPLSARTPQPAKWSPPREPAANSAPK